jgi:hypothetical protein
MTYNLGGLQVEPLDLSFSSDPTSLKMASPSVCMTSANASRSDLFCNRESSCSECLSTCTSVGSDTLSFSRFGAVLQRSQTALRTGYFFVPKVLGQICHVIEPVLSEPYSWIYPPGCNISGGYETATVLLKYHTYFDTIPAKTLITIAIENVSNPMQYCNCTGWFDLQIQKKITLFWMILGRSIIKCQALPTAGALWIENISLSNNTTGDQVVQISF